MSRRIANALARKLHQLDKQLERELLKQHKDKEKVKQLETEMVTSVKDARKKGLNLISVDVADGSCLYWEVKRTQKLATFEWLYGGGDNYISPFGKVVAVPVAVADKMLRTFKPEYVK